MGFERGLCKRLSLSSMLRNDGSVESGGSGLSWSRKRLQEPFSGQLYSRLLVQTHIRSGPDQPV